jgi:polar amino acid transport system substrate-binding protein
MTTRLTRFLAVGAGLVLAAGLTGCGSDSGSNSGSGSGSGSSGSSLETLQEGTLKVCSDVPYKPFDTLEGDTFGGFDGELVTAIAKGLGLDLQAQDAGFDGLQSGLALNSGQCDMVASAMTITDERKQNLQFSDGYYDSEQSLLVPDGSSIASIDDLSGKKLGVQKGTTGKAYATEHAKGATIVDFPSDAEEFQALKAGQVDALLQDLPVNIGHEKAGGYKVVETYSTGEQYGLAAKKGNTGLVDAVNKDLAKMKSDGTYDTIYNKYFKTN